MSVVAMGDVLDLPEADPDPVRTRMTAQSVGGSGRGYNPSALMLLSQEVQHRLDRCERRCRHLDESRQPT